MALLNFNHYFFMSILAIVIFLGLISIKYNKKIHKITINPIDLILGIIFFLSLWLFDLVSLKMIDGGLNIAVGVTSEIKMSAPVVYLFSLCGMGIIAYYYSVENSRVTRSLNYIKINKVFIYILTAGISLATIFSIFMIFLGANFSLYISDALGIYHLALSFIIISMTLLLLDLH
ncbi:MAG: hypothetical protein Q8L29_00450 [archaeon]|nr:hypothetical protein [archaeon]